MGVLIFPATTASREHVVSDEEKKTDESNVRRPLLDTTYLQPFDL